MKRLLLGPAMLPSFELAARDDHIELRMFGDYGIINMSDLPISIDRPHLLGYNFASRAFQFKVRPRNDEPDFRKRLESLFEKIQVPSKSEIVLIAEKACSVEIERCDVRSFPTFLWLETLELVRIGSKTRYRRVFVQRQLLLQCRAENMVSPHGEGNQFKARSLFCPGWKTPVPEKTEKIGVTKSSLVIRT
jgi:hypothetical protein